MTVPLNSGVGDQRFGHHFLCFFKKVHPPKRLLKGGINNLRLLFLVTLIYIDLFTFPQQLIHVSNPYFTTIIVSALYKGPYTEKNWFGRFAHGSSLFSKVHFFKHNLPLADIGI